MQSSDKLILMDRDRIARSLKRMAYQIREQNRNNKPILLCGINERGYVISRKLKEILAPLTENKIRVEQILVTEEPAGSEADNISADDQFLVVTDDVIFSGKTMFKALKLIDDMAAVPEIHTAVLIDRGHRKFPVMAEFCGMELQTKLNEHVSVSINKGILEKVQLHRSPTQ